jgi:hypothetical protein
LAQFAGCLVLEWGWGFLTLTGIGTLLFVGLLVLLIKLIGMPRTPQAASEEAFEAQGVKVSGSVVVRVVVILAAVGLIWYFISKAYDGFKDSYSVAWDSPSLGAELQMLRDKFQGETKATIIVNDPAKKFSVTGSYEGACVQDMFDAICRKYAPKLSCGTSWLHRTVVIDLTQTK